VDKGRNGTIKKYFARKNNNFMTRVLFRGLRREKVAPAGQLWVSGCMTAE